jgi:osmotically-inducible protein OsmY
MSTEQAREGAAQAGTEAGGTDDPVYTEGRIQRHLAENPDTAELGVRIAVHPAAVFLTGDVASEQRRERIVAAVRALVPALEVRDELAVTCADPPMTRETLR